MLNLRKGLLMDLLTLMRTDGLISDGGTPYMLNICVGRQVEFNLRTDGNTKTNAYLDVFRLV